MSECQICCEKINLSTRKCVACPFCEFAACRTCCETYILGESTFRCMSPACGREWTRQFISSVFTGVFMNGPLKARREQLLFDNERALLPATQPLVERTVQIENGRRELTALQDRIRALQLESRTLQTNIYRLQHGQDAQQAARVEFVRACTANGCRGFLSTQWKCGICEQWACPDCHVIKGATRDAEHTCNPDDVATATLLANDTRPCPSCHIGIFKIDGCDQMWCTQCHTAFNWRTGRVEQVVHNPHYFEWLRRNGNAVPRAAGDNPCQHNELNHRSYIGVQEILRGKHREHPDSKILEERLSRIIRNIIHMRYVIMNTYTAQNRVLRNEGLRVQYMRNHITEEDFKTTLQREEKKEEKKREIRNVMDILYTTCSDIVLRFMQHLRACESGKWQPAILGEIEPIVNYANECFREISRVYKCKLIEFTPDIHMR